MSGGIELFVSDIEAAWFFPVGLQPRISRCDRRVNVDGDKRELKFGGDRADITTFLSREIAGVMDDGLAGYERGLNLPIH